MTSLLEEGLRLALAEPKASRRRPVLLPVSKASGGTLPGIDLSRSADLLDRMEER
ncbi:MAG TPA: hypothetical protein VKV24_01550 [Casimicrobiaceae bacterium]|nr:hypothetical protein [Casimicrobiaceae bacterium]